MQTVLVPGFEARLPAELVAALEAEMRAWTEADGSGRLWRGDASLWTGGDEASWMGWLDPAARVDREALAGLGREAAAGAWSRVVVLGMGGSSLGAELLATCASARGPRLPIACLDTTDVREIAHVLGGLAAGHVALEARSRLAETLFVVASKSGSTIETACLEAFLWEELRRVCGSAAARRVLAITDPGTELESRARERGYRLLTGAPDVGGRFSALTAFGLGAAAAVGCDVEALLSSAERMRERCGPAAAARDNPAVALGLALAVLERAGYDKPTLEPPPETSLLVDWLEQLIAESTGKEAKGILPVRGQRGSTGATSAGSESPLGDSRDRYRVCWGEDRGDSHGEPEPISLRLEWRGNEDLGAELMRWQLATAVAGVLEGVNPFVQPDVEAAKRTTRALLDTPAIEEHAAASYEDDEWRWHGGRGASPRALLGDLLGSVEERDFVAILAFLPRVEETEAALHDLRAQIGTARSCATSLGFGPRYLHSTGQLFKGGANRGVYLVLTHRPPTPLAIPGRPYGFTELQSAQARGDFRVLAERGRRVLMVELLHGSIADGLERLRRAVALAL
jgi:glucose-6-phosphate isomerase